MGLTHINATGHFRPQRQTRSTPGATATPRGGWDKYQIHHIIPLQYGGTNDFDNEVALTPPELVTAHLKLDPQVLNALRKDKAPIVPA